MSLTSAPPITAWRASVATGARPPRPALLAPEAECCLTASVLLAPDLLGAAVAIAPPSCLADPTCRTIYRTAAMLDSHGHTVTAGTVTDHLERRGTTLAADVVAQIIVAVPTGCHALHYARMVRDAATRRAIAARLDTITRANESGEPIDTIGTMIGDLAGDVRERAAA